MTYKSKCGWCLGDELYESYHDQEWGVPIFEDKRLFEFLILESFQAGLSWITILRKRKNFRKAFDDFDYEKIASYTQDKLDLLLENPGIVRNKQKILATVHNAQAFIDIQQEFGSFSKYLWDFVEGKPIINKWQHYKDAPASTPLSQTISKSLKQRGFKFVGPTVIYAYMQAIGMVNDHEIGCFRHAELSYK